MYYAGDFNTSATVKVFWNTNGADGSSITRATDGTLKIYKGTSTTERSSLAGVTQSEDFDAATGVHAISIDTSDNTDSGFYAAGNDYFLVYAGMTIDGKTVNAAIAQFSIENRNIKANVTQFGGTNGTFSGGRAEVNATHWKGTALGNGHYREFGEPVLRDSTSVIRHIRIRKTTGDPMTGLTAASSGLVCYRHNVGSLEGDTFPRAVTLEDLTIGVGTWEEPTSTAHMRFWEIDATAMPGLYELHFRNEWFVSDTPLANLELTLKGVTGMAQNDVSFPMISIDLDNNRSAGLRALSNDQALAVPERLIEQSDYPQLTPQRLAEITNKVNTFWYVASTGSDSNAGTSLGKAFLTPAHAISVAGENDAIILTGETFSFSSELVIPRGLLIMGQSQSSTILTQTNGSAIDCSAGGTTFVRVKVKGSSIALNNVHGATAWDSTFIGTADILTTSGSYKNAISQWYNCTFGVETGTTDRQDGLTFSGGIHDLYNCTVTGAGDISDSNSIRATQPGCIIRMYGGSVSHNGGTTTCISVQAATGGTFFGHGVTITSPDGKFDISDSASGTTDHSGNVFLDDDCVFDAAKVRGSYTRIPSLNAPDKALIRANNVNDDPISASGSTGDASEATLELIKRMIVNRNG